MRILYDGQIYSMQVAGGINRYFANLISRLPADCEPSLAVAREREGDIPSHPRLRVYEYGRMRLANFSYRLSLRASRLEDRLLTARLARASFDVLHPTYYTLVSGRGVGSYRAPAVVTVWDMIHELFPAEMDPTGRHAEEKRRAVLAAQRVVCISENTKRDLLERYPVAEEKVSVTHLASELDESLSHGDEPVPARPYLLYVGSRSSYKNFDRLLRAFARVAPTRDALSLCVVGSPLREGERKLIAALKLAGRVEHLGYANDSHLAKLYRCSLALVYPSLYEGFGIPPLEAMACGTLAVVADTSSLPEVVGDAGVLFDPRREDELADALLSVADGSVNRDELIERGRRRAGEFSWDKTAAQTVEVYRSLGA